MILLKDKLLTAKKEHTCIWCGGPILPGEVYHYQVYIYYGDFQTNKYHPECFDDAADGTDLEGDFEFTPYDHERPIK